MQRRQRQSCGAIGANWAVFLCDSRELKNLNFGGYSRRVNQSGACSSSDVITSGGRKSETTMEDKVIVVVSGYPELYIHLRTFTKTGIHFATRLELPGRSPSHDTNSRLLCSEFHAWMKQVNSKCSSAQLHANSAIYSRLVWTHLVTYPLYGGCHWSSSGPLPSQQWSSLLWFQRTRDTQNVYCMDGNLLKLKCK